MPVTRYNTCSRPVAFLAFFSLMSFIYHLQDFKLKLYGDMKGCLCNLLCIACFEFIENEIGLIKINEDFVFKNHTATRRSI